MTTSADRRKMRSAFDEWADRIEFDWVAVLTINRDRKFAQARMALKDFALILDRDLLGPKCLEKPSERTLFLAIPEHPASNFHYHILLKVLAKKHVGWLELVCLMTHAWEKVVPGGSVHLQEVRDSGAARYAAKDLVKAGHIEEFVISTEFHSSSGIWRRHAA